VPSKAAAAAAERAHEISESYDGMVKVCLCVFFARQPDFQGWTEGRFAGGRVRQPVSGCLKCNIRDAITGRPHHWTPPNMAK